MTVTRYLGMCPVCYGDYRLRRMSAATWPREVLSEKLHLQDEFQWGMVHHGYKRPGDGAIVGDCYGVGWPPWELSPNGNIAYVALALKLDLARSENYLQRLESGEVQEFTELVHQGAWGKTTQVKLTPADGWKFTDRLRIAIRETRRRVEWLTRDIGEREALIASWVEQPMRTEEEEAQKHARMTAERRAVIEAAREAKRQKRSALDAKNQARVNEKLALISEYRDIFNDLAFRIGDDPSLRKEALRHWIKMRKRRSKKAYLNFWEKELGADEALEALGLAKRDARNPDHFWYANDYGWVS